jgi:putative chitobiose transport system substrate-binding protein
MGADMARNTVVKIGTTPLKASPHYKMNNTMTKFDTAFRPLMDWMSLLLVLCLALAGCAAQTVGHADVVTLEFWTLQLREFAPVLQPMIDRYEREHPGVRIHWVDVPFNEGKKRALTAMLSPQVPDVVNLNPGFAATLAARGALLNLSQHVAPTVQRQYVPVAWQASSLGGQAFGLPWYLTSSITMANDVLLQQAGVKALPSDWPQVLAMAKTVRQTTNAYALMPVIAENGNFLKTLLQAGVPLYQTGVTNPRAVFADREADKVLAQWVGLYQQGLVPPEALTQGHSAAVDRFQAGTLAILMAGPSFLKQVADNAPGVYAHTRVAPQLLSGKHVRGGYTDFSTMVLVVPAKSAHPQQAVDFATYITNPANQAAFVAKAPVLPSITTLLQAVASAPSLPAADLKAQAQQISAQQVLAAKVAFPLHPQQQTLNNILDFHVQLALLGKESPSQAMTKAQAEINAALQ